MAAKALTDRVELRMTAMPAPDLSFKVATGQGRTSLSYPTAAVKDTLRELGLVAGFTANRSFIVGVQPQVHSVAQLRQYDPPANSKGSEALLDGRVHRLVSPLA